MPDIDCAIICADEAVLDFRFSRSIDCHGTIISRIESYFSHQVSGQRYLHHFRFDYC